MGSQKKDLCTTACLTAWRSAWASMINYRMEVPIITEYDLFFDKNKKRWDELVAIHMKSKFYDLEGFRAGKSSLLPPEIKEMGDEKEKEIMTV